MSVAEPEDRATRVLLVDDHKMVVQAIAAILQGEPGLEVVAVAGTASEARRLSIEHAPDVVVMDYTLPDADGAETARQIRAEQPDVQVVMVTGAMHDTVLVAALEAGCAGFVTKDRAVEEVADAVRAAHAGEATIPPDMLARLLPQLRQPGRTVGGLTPRERQILQLLVEGMSNQQIADHLVLSISTIRNHVQSVLQKLEAHSRLEAVAIALRQGIARSPS